MPRCLPLALLCALLHTPSCLAQGLPALIPQRASVLNVTFDPGTWTLHWSCRDNVVVTSCTATDIKRDRKPRTQRIRPIDCRCQFRSLTLHLGVTLEVNATVNHSAVLERLSYINQGAEGSAAQNVTCVIHDAGVMTCLWGAGPTAPHDVQYFLHIRNSTGHVLMECPTYLGGHLHTGCRLDDLTLVPRHVHVAVTGSSRMGDVMFYDVTLNTKLIERLSPPDDVTVVCNSSHCAVTWSRPRTWAPMTFSDFQYEVDIQRQNPEPGSSNHKVYISIQEENRVEFPSPEPRLGHVVSVRAGDVRSKRWSVWSPFVEFGSERRVVPRLHVYLIVVTVTLLCATGLGLACKRFIRIQRLFPQVPEIKDKVSDDDRINPETLRKDLQLQIDKTD
ncbi:granulocyte-macrophage colony-stimulating factor receptor subunit alpha isoform X2 [Phodopus roborovskii]|uniref:Csf2ra protein n=2 Tax=Phodopus roborovskii TaxID=109678 RepID=A0AAU9YRD4_PHORO|nr:granulocyte-macrophage colony-stimulating factor receptor subunit alpha isoform X2 [Phodopus roborovskii]CAH6777352.1 Csf2ra [Phodopus roborovskii]